LNHIVLSVAALLLIAILSVSMFGQYPEDPHPLVYLSLDGESTDGVIDSSADGITASLINFPPTPSPFVPGVVSNALIFSGNSHVDINNSYHLSFTNGFSISLLISASNLAEKAVLAQSSDPEGNWWQFVVSTNGQPLLEFGNVAGGNVTIIGLAATNRVAQGQWQHLLGSYDVSSTSARIYMDGDTAGDWEPVPNWLPLTVQSMQFGNAGGTQPGTVFSLDELQLFPSVLSSNEATDLSRQYKELIARKAMEAADTLNFIDTTGGGGSSSGGFALLSSSPFSYDVITALTNHFCIEEVMRAMQERKNLSTLPSPTSFTWSPRFFTNGVFIAAGEAASAFPPDGFYC